MTTANGVNETGVELRPDPSRVITRFYVPGRDDAAPGNSRAAPVIERILALDERDVEAAMQDIDARFAHRHVGLHEVFGQHAEMVSSRRHGATGLSPARELLLGASFTQEYSIEAAALCNPSAVALPEQDDSGDLAFLLSVRGIGEGHRSSIGFRTGRLTAAGKVLIDEPGPFPRTGVVASGVHRRSVFAAKLDELDNDAENTMFVIDALAETFDDGDLDECIEALAAESTTRLRTAETIANLVAIARCSYDVEFATSTVLSERVLWPHAPAEKKGMEDARFVRFVDDDTGPTYYATYTAYDGSSVACHLLQTDDFVTFRASPMAGPAAVGKGLALFPRKIGGKYVALSRFDRETNSISFSDDLYSWPVPQIIQTPARPWEMLQLGNCGSPIETSAGWLVLTHGVGPMRTYSLGVILLDLNHPERVLARSHDPITTPGDGHRDGYVPNVVYSCGGFAHEGTLVLPYGVGDQTISIATIAIDELLSTLRPVT